MDGDRVETDLREILDRVDGWLKFAEAKNLALIALTGTASAAMLSFLRSAEDLPPAVLVGLTAAEVAFLVAMTTALASFLPRTAAAPAPPEDGGAAGGNLFHYGDLRRLDAAQLAGEVATRYRQLTSYRASEHPKHLDLAGQVVVNARITWSKLRAFRNAAVIALVAVIFVAGSMLARLILTVWP